jgi:hypothetical protein
MDVTNLPQTPPATPPSAIASAEATAGAVAHALADAAKEVLVDAEEAAARVTAAAKPHWTAFLTDWRSWATPTRIAFVIIVTLGSVLFIQFGYGLINFASGSIRAAHAYAHGQVVTKADLAAKANLTAVPSRAQFAALAKTVEALDADATDAKARLAAVEKQLADAEAALAAKRKKTPRRATVHEKPENSPFWSF